MFIVFSGKDAPASKKFERASTKIWRDYNDDQHMWICGSLFEFSAGDGWDSLIGFDISPESAREMSTSDNPLDKLFKAGKNNNLYVVQARKAYQDESLNSDNLERSISSKMWMMPVVEPRDKSLITPRLVRCVDSTEGETKQTVMNALEQNIALLPNIYEALIKMDQFTFTFSMQAQLATDLITNPDFTGSEEQIIALKQGRREKVALFSLKCEHSYMCLTSEHCISIYLLRALFSFGDRAWSEKAIEGVLGANWTVYISDGCAR